VQLSLPELHYNLGHVLHQQGDLAGAVACYKQALAIAPHDVKAHHSLGVVLDEQGQHGAAIDHYQQAIALDPGYIKAHNNLGCSLAKLDRRDEAIEIYRQAIETQPNWAIMHNNLGQILVKQSPVAAIAAYRRAIELEPSLVLAHHNLGRALQSQAQHELAIAHFQQAIELSDSLDSALALSDGSLSWIALNRWNQALEWLQRALEPDTAMIRAYCDWATQLQELDELSQARKNCAHFLQALLHADSAANLINIQTSLVKTYFHLGNVLVAYGGTGQYQQAERFYQQALKLQPIHTQLHLQLYLKLAECLTKQERFNAALLICQLVDPFDLTDRHQPNLYAHLYTQMGRILEQQQQWEMAIEYYQKALKSACEEQQACEKLPAAKRPLNIPKDQSSHPLDIIFTTQNWFDSNPRSGDRYISLTAPFYLPTPPVANSASSCAGLNCSPCLKRIFNYFNLTHLGNGIHTCTALAEVCITASPLFTAIISNGKAWAAPQQNFWQICNAIAILTPDHQLFADLSRDYPGSLPECQHFDPASHRFFSAELAVPEPIQGRVAVLSGLSGHNYFHWMVDILPRLDLLRQSGIEWKTIDKFWINNTIQPFQQETLTALGIPPEKILASDRHSFIQADSLIVPSFAGHLGWIEPWALEFLRREFLPIAAFNQAALPKRIYISRAQANHRRVLNETAVMQQLLPLGFVSVMLETLSFAEQVALFAQAELIIAPHGGGLTNILFCSPGTTIVELVAPSYIRHYYWVISDRLKLHHYLLAAPGVTCHPIRQLMYPSSLTEDIWVDLEALETLLHKLNLC
jgi:tetratricopeptide (TPR) repeat protein/capsular polysaccharide biosynthesis protein